ncbi:alpha-tectorin-like isoform X1 [Electrophorus electricus]|uniref:alpha-tectorin-like isoform X1 n=1 Tax=Electrophorus electricus TaxID=8005 RepID=UPI0015D052F0|nr:alpha-tectorin-like isoform X1 [Electrophorus electricus]XP_026865032.2 alpha-tectorin-like isoform X1 [Electrophorus electricus]XP_035389329.1 alpha-tectorin-like isoform X1 [Electrophorus electricus]XP_035389330.1 alpha-tectorin-like isoform X1 [Electrophorus electricus]
MFLGLYFSASWLFITTWVAVPYSSNTGVATFQMVLVGGEDDELSFLLMNYGDIAPTGQPWLAGYRSESGIYKYTIDEPNPSDLSKSTNKGLPGQWAFRVDEEMDDCRTLHCTKDEVCVEKTGIYGCDCAKENKRPNSEIFGVQTQRMAPRRYWRMASPHLVASPSGCSPSQRRLPASFCTATCICALWKMGTVFCHAMETLTEEGVDLWTSMTQLPLAYLSDLII